MEQLLHVYQILGIAYLEMTCLIHDMPQKVFKSPEASAFSPKTPTAEKVIKTVRGAGGIIALAHPVNRTHFAEELVKMGLNGIEVSHPNMDEQTVALALEAAREFNLYHCGGTDHTGPMSGCGGKLAVPVFSGITEEEYTTLTERRLGR